MQYITDNITTKEDAKVKKPLKIIVLVTLIMLMPVCALAQPNNGWWKNGTNWYYFKNGEAVIGWQTIDGEKYYFDTYTSAMYSDRWLDNKYYFKSSGAMTKGWVKTNSGIWYYFNHRDGKLYSWKEDHIHPNCLYFYREGKYHNMRSNGGWVSECTKSGHNASALMLGPLH